MPLWNLQFEQITVAQLEALRTVPVAEGRRLEYKREVAVATGDDKREFLYDVTSFANGAGGHILIGVECMDGLPIALTGLDVAEIDSMMLRMQNLLRDCVQPRLPGVLMRGVGLPDGRAVLVVRVPQSWIGPHMVRMGRTTRFYTRSSAGKHEMDIDELRQAFALTGSLPQRLREFRDARLCQVGDRTLPIILRKGPLLVVHALPVSAWTERAEVDLSGLNDRVADLQMLRIGSSGGRYSLDGFTCHTNESRRAEAAGYLHVFRGGQVEVVDGELLSESPLLGGDGNLSTAGEHLGSRLLQHAAQALRVQASLGVPSPVWISIALLHVEGLKLYSAQSLHSGVGGQPIDRHEVRIPMSEVREFDSDLSDALRPALDTLWNACGYPRCWLYDKDGASHAAWRR